MASTRKNLEKGAITRAKILKAVIDLNDREGRPATQAEICKVADVSVGSLLHHLPRMLADGDIVLKPGPRGIIPVRHEASDITTPEVKTA